MFINADDAGFSSWRTYRMQGGTATGFAQAESCEPLFRLRGREALQLRDENR